jgi:hypothetical protein
MSLFNFFEENTEVLPEIVETGSVSDKPSKSHHKHDEEHGAEVDVLNSNTDEEVTRASMSTHRLTDWAIHNADRLSIARPSNLDVKASKRMSSVNMDSRRSVSYRESMGGTLTIASNIHAAGTNELRSSFIGGAKLRPNVPSNRKKF